MENNFGNMSPVVNHDVFPDDMTDLAPTPILLPSQLTVTEDSIIVPAAGSLGRLPAAGLPKLPAAGTMMLSSVTASCDGSGIGVGAKSVMSSGKTS